MLRPHSRARTPSDHRKEFLPSVAPAPRRLPTPGFLLGAALLAAASAFAQTLVFHSGFSPATSLIEIRQSGALHQIADITGIDNGTFAGGTRNSWTTDLEEHPKIGSFDIQVSTVGSALYNDDTHYPSIASDPTGSGRGEVLRFTIRDGDPAKDDDKTRVQARIGPNAPTLVQATSAVKVFFPAWLKAPLHGVNDNGKYTLNTSAPILQEWWPQNSYGSIDDRKQTLIPYRYSSTDPELYWSLMGYNYNFGTGVNDWWARTSPGAPTSATGATFNAVANGVPIPFGEWFTLVTYWSEGIGDGAMKVGMINNGVHTVLFDIANCRTQGSLGQKGLAYHHVMKFYAKNWVWRSVFNQAGQAAAVYWDDWEYYEGNAYDLIVGRESGVGIPPAAPATLSATAQSDTQVALAWPDVAYETVYTIERKTGSGPFQPLATATAGATAYLDATAAPGANTVYQIQAGNTYGGSGWTISNVVPGGCAATQAIAATVPGVGSGTIRIANRFDCPDPVTELRWSVVLPAGWSLAGSDAAGADLQPVAGTTSLVEWRWTTPPSSPVTFSYTLAVAGGEVVARPLAALVELKLEGAPGRITAKPDPLQAGLTHSADTNCDFRIDAGELVRVVELYDTRHGATRTGCYAVAAAAGGDGFAPDPTTPPGAAATLARHHSADTDRDGRLSLSELTRVIALYNQRTGGVRTGAYHGDADAEGGFAPGL